MIIDKKEKLTKYLFLISVLLLLTVLSHLIYSYLYNGAQYIPVKGGNVSEALIGEFPSLNPLNSNSGNDKYVVELLYRSLMTYNNIEKKIVGDLATCDISNLGSIECFLKENIKWSDGNDINTTDILSTYNILQNTEINPFMTSLLQDVNISNIEGKIVFKSEKKDVNILHLLFQPIVPDSVLNELRETELSGSFPSIDGIYSGKYKIGNITQDSSLGITNLILEKNEHYDDRDLFLDTLTLRIFENNSQFMKHKETINIFNDEENLLRETIPRFDNYDYTLPQYVGLFINQDKLRNEDLRAFLLNMVNRENLIKILGIDKYQKVQNPYLTDVIMDKVNGDKNIEKILSGLGYYKKSNLIEILIGEKKESLISDEISESKSETLTGTIEEPIKIDKSNIYGGKSLLISHPDFIDKYNFISKADLLLKGNADPSVDAIYVNEYKLQGYKKGDNNFYYRLKESYGTIKKGENKYDIYFETNGEKELKETLFFIYDSSPKELERLEVEFLDKKEKEMQKKKLEELAEESEKQIVETDEDKEKIEEIKKLIANIDSLEDHFFYNKDLEKFSLNISYINSEENIFQTAKFVESAINNAGVNVKLKAISLQDLNSGEEKGYDMIITGINLGYFDFNIYSYFHSGQAKDGYNLTGIKKLSLDIILEELKSNILSKTKIAELENKVIEILKEAQVAKILYTPIHSMLIDKNIKNYNIHPNLPQNYARKTSLSKIYINEKKVINIKEKSIGGFFKYLVYIF